MTTQKIEHIVNDSLLLDTTTPPKRSRGRPAKYTKEEREDKYKEAKENWKQEHKEHIKEQRKEYYEAHQKEIIQNKKNYGDRSRYALRILNALYHEKESLNSISPDLRSKISSLIEHKKMVCF